MKKTCTKCDIKKDISEFYRHRTQCKGCCIQIATTRKKLNREHVNEVNRRHWHKLSLKDRKLISRKSNFARSGWTVEAYETQLSKQGGLCATPCCDRPVTDADHDHKLNLPRFLLCHGCNNAIGQTHENAEILEALAQMLREWQSV